MFLAKICNSFIVLALMGLVLSGSTVLGQGSCDGFYREKSDGSSFVGVHALFFTTRAGPQDHWGSLVHLPVQRGSSGSSSSAEAQVLDFGGIPLSFRVLRAGRELPAEAPRPEERPVGPDGEPASSPASPRPSEQPAGPGPQESPAGPIFEGSGGVRVSAGGRLGERERELPAEERPLSDEPTPRGPDGEPASDPAPSRPSGPATPGPEDAPSSPLFIGRAGRGSVFAGRERERDPDRREEEDPLRREEDRPAPGPDGEPTQDFPGRRDTGEPAGPGPLENPGSPMFLREGARVEVLVRLPNGELEFRYVEVHGGEVWVTPERVPTFEAPVFPIEVEPLSPAGTYH